MRRRCLLAAACLAVLCGCDVGPDYKPPKPAVPPAWDQAPPGALAGWPAADWWTAFGSSQLDALMEKARQGNTDVAAAAARVRAADAQTRVAGAPLLPSLNVEPEAGPERVLNNTGKERHHTVYQGLFQASYELDFWGKNQAALDQARATADASRYQQGVVWLTTSTAVANTYLAILALQNRLQIAVENQARAQRSLDATVEAQRQGIVPELDVVQQQAVVASLVTVLPPLRQQLAAMRNALAVLVGELPEQLRLADERLDHVAIPAISAGLPSGLLARRPDVLAAEAQLIAANANIRIARAQLFPSIDLTASGGLASYALTQYTTGPLGVYSVLASLTQPIFEGGALQGRLGLARAQYQALLVGTYRNAVLSAFSDVENALASLQASADEDVAQQATLTLARRSNGLATGAFRGGTSTITAVLLSETSLYTTQDAAAEARLARLQAVVGLFGALGGGWSKGAR